jgi:replication-associated recombination protein RarA
MTDYKWEVDECEVQRQYFETERKDKRAFQSKEAQFDRELSKSRKVSLSTHIVN